LTFRGMANPLRERHHEDKQAKKNVLTEVRGIANSNDLVLTQGLYMDDRVFVVIPRRDWNSTPWSIRTFSSTWK
ncbi:hypothetical protein BHE74_00017423, partial [Ensete ventricosum]